MRQAAVGLDEDGVEIELEHFLGGVDQRKPEFLDLGRLLEYALGVNFRLAGTTDHNLRTVDPLLLVDADMVEPADELIDVRGIEIDDADTFHGGNPCHAAEGSNIARWRQRRQCRYLGSPIWIPGYGCAFSLVADHGRLVTFPIGILAGA